MDMDNRNASPQQARVLILKADRLYADSLRQHTKRVLRSVEITIVSSLTAARAHLSHEIFDVFITGLGESCEGDTLDLIAQCKKPPLHARHVLVVTMRRDYRILAALHSLPIDGILDSASEPASAFATALQTVIDGARFWSPSITCQIQKLASSPAAVFRTLTGFEQVVLSLVGGGCDDAEAAQQLALSPATISTVRRGLHRKLHVQHRGELIRLAAQNGFVRFTPEGVERPGLALLAAAYHPRDPKRSAPGLVQLASA